MNQFQRFSWGFVLESTLNYFHLISFSDNIQKHQAEWTKFKIPSAIKRPVLTIAFLIQYLDIRFTTSYKKLWWKYDENMIPIWSSKYWINKMLWNKKSYWLQFPMNITRIPGNWFSNIESNQDLSKYQELGFQGIE